MLKCHYWRYKKTLLTVEDLACAVGFYKNNKIMIK